jgi:hypothetical protein
MQRRNRSRSPRTVCDQWRANPLVNPRTGRRIVAQGPTFRALQAECQAPAVVVPLVAARRSPRIRGRVAAPVAAARAESPCDRWRATPLVNPRTGRTISLNGPTYRALERECLEEVAVRAVSPVRRGRRRRDPSPVRRGRRRRASPPRRDPSPPRNTYGSRIMRILGEQYYRRGGPITVAELQTRIGDPNNLAQTLRAIRSLITDYYSINFVAGPTDLTSTVEYRPFNGADVRRNIVPIPQDRPAERALRMPDQVNRDARIKLGLEPRLSKQEKLQNLREECSDMTDPISIEDFEDLSDDDLATVVKIGDRPPKHCYKLENIRSHLTRQQRQGLENKDPLNPSYIIPRNEVREIMRN